MPEFRDHKYTYSKPYTAVRHQWELRAAGGGVHFHVALTKDYEPSCGLEFHHGPELRHLSGGGDGPPAIKDCWLCGGHCWPDGTSSYASETLWPQFKAHLAQGDHDSIFRTLEYEWRKHVERASE
jgi:hypothetical protein